MPGAGAVFTATDGEPIGAGERLRGRQRDHVQTNIFGHLAEGMCPANPGVGARVRMWAKSGRGHEPVVGGYAMEDVGQGGVSGTAARFAWVSQGAAALQSVLNFSTLAGAKIG